MKKKKLIILDGNSLIYRAFFALPPLTTKEGIYTNGVYGFLTMLYKIFDEYNPDYISVAFDPGTPTFRHKEFDDYKAGRAKTPDELRGQFAILKEVLDKLGINRIEVDGFEADDVAGSMARYGQEQDLDVILVTGDKDYLQLASDRTKVLITKKGLTNLESYDDKAVMERYELTPKQFIDLKGLMGDKSDNIPGVPGVGEKTGIKLLKEFGTMEGIYDNIDKVSGVKLKERLIENRQQAFMSRRLATIITNMPLEFNLEALEREMPDATELYELYKKLEFNSLLDKIDSSTIDGDGPGEQEIYDEDIILVNDKDKFNDIIGEIKKAGKFILKFLGSDGQVMTNTTLALGVKITEDKSYYINFGEEGNNVQEWLGQFKTILENKDIKKSGHDLKNDILVLLRHGIEIKGIDFDTMIAQYLIDASQSTYSIKSLAQEYLNSNLEEEEDFLGKGKKKLTFSQLSIEDRSKFLNSQLGVIYHVERPMKEKIEEQEMKDLLYKVEIPLIEVLANMEYRGFRVDLPKLEVLGEEFNIKIETLTEGIHNLAGETFNINSPKQLGHILFDKLGLPVIKKTKTGYSTNAEVLEKLMDKHEIIQKILDYRQIVKLKSTYIDGLIAVINKETGKVHSSFNQTITTTGRISSTEPNLQNIPIKTEEGRKIRKVFMAQSDEFTLVDADYSQIELRVLAHISEDDKLKEAFYTNEDIHTKTASEVFDVPKDDVTSLMRSRAKAVNFGIVYGISDYGLSRDLNITRKEAKKYIDNYLANYERVKEYMENIIKKAKEDGYVTTILNRRRYIPEINSRNFNVRSFGERTAMNTPIQGSAADIIKVAMVNVYNELKRRKLRSKLILQVHDELIIETHKEESEEVQELLKSLMENAVTLKVPLKVDMETGDSWYDTK